MTRSVRSALAAAILAASTIAAAHPQTSAPIVVTTQLLDYERGFLFITDGDGFRVAPDVVVHNAKTHLAAQQPPKARDYARVTFSSDGFVTEIDLSSEKLPPEGSLSDIHRFALAASPSVANPELSGISRAAGSSCPTRAGHRTIVTFVVRVPADTPLTDNVYMTTDQSGWNPQAYRLDRMDALHFHGQITFNSGTVLQYLFDRGSTSSIEVAENGLDQPPYKLCIGLADVQAEHINVYHWADQIGNGINQVPLVFPTPYNPAPFPNLPTMPPSVPGKPPGH